MKEIELDEIIDRISNIENESFKNSWNKKIIKAMLNKKEYIIVIEKIDENIVGYIILYDTSNELEILRIAVDRNYRHRGIGEKLLKKSINIMRKMSYKYIFLEVRVTNIIAISFYKKNGFKEIAVRKNYYKDTNEDAIIMQKEV